MVNIYCSPRHGSAGSPAAYALLARAYGLVYGGDMPEIKKTPNGKPYFPAEPYVFFSLSHSKTHVLCAISDSPVGADLESPRLISERAQSFFSTPEELSMFEPLELWVLKESYVKLIGGTLKMVRSIRFLRRDGGIFTPGNDCFSKLIKIGDCIAAVSAFEEIKDYSIELIDSYSEPVSGPYDSFVIPNP